MVSTRVSDRLVAQARELIAGAYPELRTAGLDLAVPSPGSAELGDVLADGVALEEHVVCLAAASVTVPAAGVNAYRELTRDELAMLFVEHFGEADVLNRVAEGMTWDPFEVAEFIDGVSMKLMPPVSVAEAVRRG